MNTPRFDAVHAELEPGTLLLEASAGTGKTWSLTTIATRLVVEGRIDAVEKLLMVTFTNAATQELRERLGRRLRDARAVLEGGDPGDDVYLKTLVDHPDAATVTDRIKKAVVDLDLVRISTIHGFCARILQDTAFEAGLAFDTDDTENADHLRETAVADAWRVVVQSGPPWRAAWLEIQGHRFGEAVKDFDRYLRARRARHLPQVDSLVTIDLEVASAFQRLIDDVDALATLAAFLDEGIPVTAKGVAWPQASLRRRLFDGHFAADAESWIEIANLLPSRQLFNKTRLKKSKHWSGVVELLTPLDELMADAFVALRLEICHEAVRRFEHIKRTVNVRDFDDMIGEVRRRLDDPEASEALVQRVRDVIDVALIDEFQDTDLDQWTIFSRLFAGKRLILVGDPKQAIYGFRGADVFAYLEAKKGAEVRSLPENHRSHPQLVEAVNRFFVAPGAFVIDALDAERVDPAKSAASRALTGDDGPAFQLDFLDADAAKALVATGHEIAPDAIRRASSEIYREAAALRTVETIRNHLRRGITIDGEDFDAGRIAVLTRKHAESRRVHKALREAGIDAVIAGSGDIRATEVYADVVRMLEAILDPTDRRRVQRALATRMWGKSLSELTSLESDAQALQDVQVELDALHTRWKRRGAFEVLSDVVVACDTERRWLSERDGERDLTDLRHAMEFVHALEDERGLGPEALVRALWEHHDDTRPELELDVTRLRLERDAKAVKIVTIHASKGLEFDLVIVPFAWEARLEKPPWSYHEGADAMVDWRDDKDFAHDFSRRARAEALAEDMRLLYVAFTRASRRCIVFDTAEVPHQKKEKQLASLHFLLHRTVRGDESVHEWITRLAKENVDRPDLRRNHLADFAEGDGFGWLDTTVPEVGDAIGNDFRVKVEARALDRCVRDALEPWRVSSFTALARGVHDVDPRFDERDDPETPVAHSDVEADGIFAFARGARAGNCLHEVLEVSPFDADPQDDAHRRRLEGVLRRHDLLDPARHDGAIDPLEVVARLVERVGDETFPGASAPLREIGEAQRANEWEFRLPVERLDLPALADAVAAHAHDDFTDAWVARLRTHRDPQVKGLFGGVVDLVFELDGVYRIVDWKSNHLGNTTEAYDHDAMRIAMLEHDYYLQMLLYQVGLHRHLRSRVPDYDYDTHCGGAAYAFLRGLCGEVERGWVAWCPPRELVDAVDAGFATARVGEAR